MERKRSKYSRRSAQTVHRSRTAVAIVVLVLVLLAAAALAVVIGNLLGARIEALERQRGEEIKPIDTIESIDSKKEIPAARARHFEYASRVTSYTTNDIYDFSVCLRDAGGYVPYASAVASEYGADGTGDADLQTKAGDIHEYSGTVYGYFYSDCLSENNANIRRIKKAYEISLISEASAAGVDDILLLGISVNVGNVEEVLGFVREIKNAVGEGVSVGIACDCSTLLATGKDIYIAGKLLRGCDYLALDLRDFVYAEAGEGEEFVPGYDPSTGGVSARDLSQLLSLMKYYIKSYSLRTLFDASDDRSLSTYADMGFNSYQTVKREYRGTTAD